jgi:hypothetical protein
LLVATIALILVALALANFVAGGKGGGVLPYLVTSALAIVVAAIFFLRVIPDALRPEPGNRPARIGLILGIVALVLVVVFWSGLPFALGVPALVLGVAGRERAPDEGRTGEATAALVLGGLAIVAAFAACLVG